MAPANRRSILRPVEETHANLPPGKRVRKGPVTMVDATDEGENGYSRDATGRLVVPRSSIGGGIEGSDNPYGDGVVMRILDENMQATVVTPTYLPPELRESGGDIPPLGSVGGQFATTAIRAPESDEEGVATLEAIQADLAQRKQASQAKLRQADYDEDAPVIAPTGGKRPKKLSDKAYRASLFQTNAPAQLDEPSEEGSFVQQPRALPQAAPQGGELATFMQMLQLMQPMLKQAPAQVATPVPAVEQTKLVPEEPEAQAKPKKKTKGVKVAITGAFGTIKMVYADIIVNDVCLVLISDSEAENDYDPPVDQEAVLRIKSGDIDVRVKNFGLTFERDGSKFMILILTPEGE